MNKLTLVVSPSQVDNVTVIVEPSVYALNDTYYLVPTGFNLETVAGLKQRIRELEFKCERRLKGIEYWKTKVDSLISKLHSTKEISELRSMAKEIDEIIKTLT